jgi:hypothetical protein
MKRTIFAILAFCLALSALAVSTFAQRDTATGIQVEKDLDLLRHDIRAEKKKIIAMNVPLTDVEATKFWPVYDQYAADMTKHYDQFYGVIKEYAANQKTLTDAQAIDMIKRWSDIQLLVAQTRQKYVPIIEKVIPGKKAALFFQIDRRLYSMMDLQVASEVPLVYQ